MRYEWMLCMMAGIVVGCHSVVDLKVEDKEPRIVLNSVLLGGCDSVVVKVAMTRLATEEKPWRWREDAEVCLYEEGKRVADGQARGKGEYVFFHRVKYATAYRVEVEVPGCGKAWGETRVPSLIEEGHIRVQPEDTDESWRKICKVKNRWKDETGNQNYYWFCALEPDQRTGDTTDMNLVYEPYSNSPLADPFNQVIDQESDVFTCYDYYIRVEDSGFDGQDMKLEYQVSYPEKLIAIMMSVDSHYDAYMKSSIINFTNDTNIVDFPLFYEPSYTYVNIHGGAGLVGSYVYIQTTIRKP